VFFSFKLKARQGQFNPRCVTILERTLIKNEITGKQNTSLTLVFSYPFLLIALVEVGHLLNIKKTPFVLSVCYLTYTNMSTLLLMIIGNNDK